MNKEIKRANKNHECDWCLRRIEKGRKYSSQTFFKKDGVFRLKTHNGCWDISQLANEGIYETFNEGIYETFYDKGSFTLLELEELDNILKGKTNGNRHDKTKI